MSFPRYLKYKDSGVKWLGKVPEHWTVTPVRAVADHIDRRNEDAACQDYLSLMANVGVIPYAEKGDIGNKKPEDLSKCKLVDVGDIVINSMNYNIGSYGLSRYRGVCSPVYVVLRVREECALQRFAFRVFQNTAFQKYAASFGNGILAHRAAIGWHDLKAIGIAVPPKSEQGAILSFLDEETAKIDALIEEQRQLIELLKEKRQAVILHAVTKGTRPRLPMKDSGIRWIGEVPEHWPVGKFRFYARFSTGSTPNRENPAYWNGPIPWVKTGEIRYETITDTEETITELALSECSVSLVNPGAVLMALYGQGVTRGRVALLGVPATFNQACVAIEPDRRLSNRYLEAFCTAAYQYIRELGNETTQQNLNVDFVRSLPLPIPPINEQTEIAEFLKTELPRWDELVENSETAIAVLQERRSALISAAVTGKIDVRNYAPHEDQAAAEEMYEPA